VFSCCVTLEVFRDRVVYVSRLLYQERVRRGTRTGTRLLTCPQPALYLIAWLRDRLDVRRFGSGLGLSRPTAYRYRDERIAELANQSTNLRETPGRAREERLSHPIPDGEVIATDRVTEPKLSRKGTWIDAWYAGKFHDFGALVQALMDPRGIPRRVRRITGRRPCRPRHTHAQTESQPQVLRLMPRGYGTPADVKPR
jgi:hypothetical protein